MTDPNPAPQPAANPADPVNPNPAPIPDPAPNPNPNPAPDPAPAPKAWGDTWRQELAGDDEKALKQLERFTTPKAMWESYQQAYQKIRSGELAKPLPENATPEQIAEYRQARGIPDKSEGYLEKLPNGLVIGEDDRPIFESLVKKLHEGHADPKTVHGIVEWYNHFQQEQAAKTSEADTSHRAEVEDALRQEWGADYRANVNHIKAFLETAPAGVADRIADARDSEGRAVLNDPNVMRWLASMAREMNPAHTIVPGTSGNDGQTIATEIDKIEKFMRTNRTEYNRDAKMQERYLKLLDARIAQEKRGRAA